MTTTETIVYEAEDLVLDDFYIVNGSKASGGQLIKLCGQDGVASTDFNHASAYYDITIWAQDECDGQSTIEVVINGLVVGTIVLDQDDDGAGSDNGRFSAFTLDNVLVEAGAEIELRAVRDDGEWVRIDKITFDKVGEIGNGSSGGSCDSEVLMTETFDGKGSLTKSSNIVGSAWYRQNDTAMTNGNKDGNLTFREVDLTGFDSAAITLEAKIVAGSLEAWGTSGGDRIRIELIDQNGTVHLLDQFSGNGQTMVGSVTGQTITGGHFSGLTYTIPAGLESAQLRIRSDISSCGEKIAIDNVEITGHRICDPGGGGEGGGDPVVITLDAVDDSFSVAETEDVAANILANDSTNSGQALTVAEIAALGDQNTGANAQVGQAFTVTTEGGRTGTVTVAADGSFTFDGGDNFRDLTDGQTDSFQLSYTIRVPAEEQVKHNLLFVLDISNSTVNGNGTQQDVFVGTGVGDVNGDGLADTVLDAQIAGVIAAVQNLLDKGADPSKIDIGIVTFSGKASGYTTVDAETLGTFALDSTALIDTLKDITRGGWTNYEAGLKQARDWFASQQGDGAVNKMYFLSDGRPAIGYQNGQYIYQGMAQYGDEIGAIVNTYGAEVHAIGVGANSDLAYLNDLDNTGGAEQVLDTTSLTAILEETTGVLVEDTATVTVVINGEGRIIDAIDDAITVSESEGFGDVDGNVMANDILPDMGETLVIEINGQQADIGQWVDLAQGGRVRLNGNGTFDFDADGDFDALNDGQSAQVQFDYTIRNTAATSDRLVVTFAGGNGLKAMVTITEVAGDLKFDVQVLEGAGDIGDLRGVFFHLADEGLIPGLSVTGADVTSSQFAANAVKDLGNGANMNGGFGAFDAGVQLGTQGIGCDDIRSTSFILSHATQSLSLADLNGQDFGLRLTSVGAEGGSRGDSLKLGGTAVTGSSSTLVDSATVTVTIEGEDTVITVDALDNAYAVGEAEGIAANIIADDLLNGAPAAPGELVLTDVAVVDAAGQTAMTVGQAFTVTTAGGRTGTVTVNADGSFTFDGGGNFADLNDGETDSFRLAYTVATATETTVTRTADFDGPNLAAGTIVSDQIDGVTISAVRKGHTGENAAMIFDADNPTGGDWDLHQPGQGGVLIITEDFDGNDPDDNAQGGTFTFCFDEPSTVQALTFLDTEEPTPVLKFYDEGGALIAQMNGPTTTDGGMASMTFGIAGVKTMTVELKGSGAIAGLTFDTTTTTMGVSDTAYVDVVINGEGTVDLLPVAVDDALSTDEATAASINLLDNDMAGDGALTIVAIDGGTADGTPFTLTSADGRTATFTLQPDGTLTVDPGADFATLARDEVREFTLSYTIEDADGDQSTATVTVTVNGLNEGPVAEDDAATADEAVVVITGNVMENDSDPNGDAISVVSAGGVAPGTAIAVSGISTKGTALDGTLTVNADGSYSFVPGAGYDAMDQDEAVTFTVSYVIEDVHGAQATADLTITVEGLNEPPVAADDAAVADEDAAAVTGNVMANDSDPNGDAIAVTSAGGQAPGTELALAATTSLGRPVTATLTVAADGSYSLIPGAGMASMAAGETVSFAVGYEIADVWGGTAAATLTVTLNGLNEAPVAVSELVTATETVSSILGNILANDSDPNEDAYSDDPISVVSAGGVAPGTAIAVSATSAMGVALAGTLTVAENGSWSFTPGSGFGDMARFDTADFVIDYTVEDSHGAQDTAQLTIRITGVNDAPDAIDNDYDVAETGQLAGNLITDDTGSGVDSDPNGDDIFVVAVKQGGVSLGNIGDSWTVTSDNGRTGTLTVATDGSFIFTPGAEFEALGEGEKDTIRLTYTIEDVHGAQSSADFTIDVMGEDNGGGGGGGGGAPTINVAFVVDVSSSMFVDNLSSLPVGDVNGDGQANTKFDLAYHAISEAVAALETAAATAGYALKVGLVGFDDAAIDAVTWTGAASLAAWGAGSGLVFQQGNAGDSDVDTGLAEAMSWFGDIGADAADDNQIVLLSDGQFTAVTASAMIANFASSLGGTTHSRFTAPLEETANWASVEAVDAVSTDAVTPYDADGKFFIYDELSATYALQAADILDFV